MDISRIGASRLNNTQKLQQQNPARNVSTNGVSGNASNANNANKATPARQKDVYEAGPVASAQQPPLRAASAPTPVGKAEGVGQDCSNQSYSEADYAKSVDQLHKHFDLLDTAGSKWYNPNVVKDGIVSKDDLKAAVGKENWSPDLKEACQFFLDNPDAFERLESAKNGQNDGKIGKEDVKIEKGNVDNWRAEQAKDVQEVQEAQEVEADVDMKPADSSSLEAFPVIGEYNIGFDENWDNFDPKTGLQNSDFSLTQTDANHRNGHLGNDIFAPRGTPVVAPVSGEVVSAGYTEVGGYCVTVKRDDTYFYLAHMDSIADGIEPGMQISAGTSIGTVGNTGSAKKTEPHVHFSIYEGEGGYSSNPIDPFPYLDEAHKAA